MKPSELQCPPCNQNCNQGRTCPARVEEEPEPKPWPVWVSRLAIIAAGLSMWGTAALIELGIRPYVPMVVEFCRGWILL